MTELDDKIEIFGIHLDNLAVKDAMKQTVSYLDSEALNVIEIVSLETLMQGQDQPEWKGQIQDSDLVLPGESAILETVGITDEDVMKDLDHQVFFKVLARYLRRNHRTLFLLGETKEELDQLSHFLSYGGNKAKIVGKSVLLDDPDQEESVINEINSVEPDCIISTVSAPFQEKFITSRKALLNSRIFLGCGCLLSQLSIKESRMARMRHFMMKALFRYRVEKEKEEGTKI